MLLSLAAVALGGCDGQAPSAARPSFKGIDITGAEYARTLALTDADGKARTLAEDRGIRCVTLDYDQMRGMDSNEYRLF